MDLQSEKRGSAYTEWGVQGHEGHWGAVEEGGVGKGGERGEFLPMWQPCLGQVLTQTIPDG